MNDTKTWLVTGTSTGLGRLLTELALERGHRVAATLRDPAALDALKGTYGDRLWVARLDVTDAGAVRDVVGRAFGDLGRIDVVVNNAGYGLFGAAEELADAQIRLQIDTNLIGSIHVIRAALPHLRAQGGGKILQVSSEGGQVTYPNFAVYHATKWGIEGFVEAVAQEVKPFGIGFTIVELGATGTSFSANLAVAEASAAYDKTPSGDMRRALGNGAFGVKADAGSTVRAMFDVALAAETPLRVALGSAAFAHVRDALASRLAALEGQERVAASADTR